MSYLSISGLHGEPGLHCASFLSFFLTISINGSGAQPPFNLPWNTCCAILSRLRERSQMGARATDIFLLYHFSLSAVCQQRTAHSFHPESVCSARVCVCVRRGGWVWYSLHVEKQRKSEQQRDAKCAKHSSLSLSLSAESRPRLLFHVLTSPSPPPFACEVHPILYSTWSFHGWVSYIYTPSSQDPHSRGPAYRKTSWLWLADERWCHSDVLVLTGAPSSVVRSRVSEPLLPNY